MEEAFINFRGINIYTKTIGSGEPLVFLHGGPGGDHRYFLPHLEDLANHFQLVFYDQAGCGKSGPLPDESYSMDTEVELLEELRKSLGFHKLNLIGESWGSMLSLLYASKYPTHVGKIFMTAAVGATKDAYLQFGKEIERRLTDEEKQLLNELSTKLSKGEVEVSEIFNIIDPFYVFSRETLGKRTPTNSNAAVNRIIGQDIIENYDVSKYAHVLKEIPILVAQGEHDLITPSMLEDTLVSYIPHIQVKGIKECGHWSVVEKPGELMSLVKEFLQ
ncbi:alpha/beta fold hydrolase [Cytobacillus suaedae]|nr:alpha/beta fold hydrolase [Cytobacillus suaedae]